MSSRYAAVDVHYPGGGGARAALVVAAGPRMTPPWEEHITWLDRVEEYQPGNFFRRELPAIQAVLSEAPPVDLLVIDGYVDLDPTGRPGLGARVHAAAGMPVVGVAKTHFRSATHAVPLRRGNSARPLFITSAGIALDDAVQLVAEMSGSFRLPDALRAVDCRARGKQSAFAE